MIFFGGNQKSSKNFLPPEYFYILKFSLDENILFIVKYRICLTDC